MLKLKPRMQVEQNKSKASSRGEFGGLGIVKQKIRSGEPYDDYVERYTQDVVSVVTP